MRSLIIAMLVFSVGCASTSANGPRRAGASEPRTEFEKALASFGVSAYFANLHAHHYMGYGETKKIAAQTLDASGPCSKSQKFPQDDGRPCRETDAGPDMIVQPFSKNKSTPAIDDYFQMACDYAREQGQLDIMFITPHTKNNQKNQDQQQSDADTKGEELQKRHQMLSAINKPYNGTFLCGLGQEASSISAGNHLGIFGQFRADKTAETKPFFFPAGQFDVLYPQVKERAAAGEKIILQMNHPDSQGDLYMDDVAKYFEMKDSKDKQEAKKGKKFVKEGLNDYGLDDFQPIRCAKQQGCEGAPVTTVDDAALRQTYAAIREAAGDRFRLIEIAPTGGATSNPTVDFAPVQHRQYAYDFSVDKKGEDKDGGDDSGGGSFENSKGLLYDYIYYLAMGFHLGPVANQDNHRMNYGTSGSSRTGVLATALTEEAVLTALDGRHTFASEDKNAKVLFFTDTGEAETLMGSEFTTTQAKAKLVIGYQDPDPDDQDVMVRVYFYRKGEPLDFSHSALRSDTVRLVTFNGDKGTLPGNAIALQTLNDKGFSVKMASGELKTLEIPLEMGGQYVFVEVTQWKDLDKIWSAPVWLNRVAPPAR